MYTHTYRGWSPPPPPLPQDVSESDCYRFPQLYIAGQQNKNFNNFIFFRSLMKGIYVAIAFFFMLFGMTAFNQYPSGYEWDYQSYSLAASGALTIIVNLQVLCYGLVG